MIQVSIVRLSGHRTLYIRRLGHFHLDIAWRLGGWLKGPLPLSGTVGSKVFSWFFGPLLLMWWFPQKGGRS